MKDPAGEPLAIEECVLAEACLSREQFASAGTWRFEGERRPLRIPLSEVSAALDEEGLLLGFSLPRGAYATAVLREIMKTEAVS